MSFRAALVALVSFIVVSASAAWASGALVKRGDVRVTCQPPYFTVSPADSQIMRQQPETLSALLITWVYSQRFHQCVEEQAGVSATWRASGGKLQSNPSGTQATFESGGLGIYTIWATYGSDTAEAQVAVQPNNEAVLSQLWCNAGCDAVPTGQVIADKNGALYATIANGGSVDAGDVLQITASASGYTTREIFAFNGQDGQTPLGGLVADSSGAFYGVAYAGGTGPCSFSWYPGCGTVYKLTASGSGFNASVSYVFQGGSDGSNPAGALFVGPAGVLYGTTTEGGGSASCSGGCGTVFSLIPEGSTYKEKILYAFAGGNDGGFPLAGVFRDKYGNLFGTTVFGGGTTCSCGIVFELDHANGYRERILSRFKGGADGAFPTSGLTGDRTGTLYGTTYAGAGGACRGSAGCGTVYKVTPNGSGYERRTLRTFTNAAEGAQPSSGVIDVGGALYGQTFFGGFVDAGVIFKLVPSGNRYAYKVVHNFEGTPFDGSNHWLGLDHAPSFLLPPSPLVLRQGVFYGSTYTGGNSFGLGTVFALKL